MNGLTLLDHISTIKDPRQKWKVEHTLSDILFLAVVAVIAGAGAGRKSKTLVKINLLGYSNTVIIKMVFRSTIR